MIAVNGCAFCQTASQELQPVGWARVRVIAMIRRPDEDSKRIIETKDIQFYVCEQCFEKWWQKK